MSASHRLVLVVGSMVVGAALITCLKFFEGHDWRAVYVGGLIGGLAGGGGAVLFVAALRANRLVRTAEEHLTTLINVRPLTACMPIQVDGWTTDTEFLRALANVVSETRPKVVVECGAGLSSVVIASCLGRFGCGDLWCLESGQEYARKAQVLLDSSGLPGRVLFAPLEEYEVDGGVFQWYASQVVSQLPNAIDVLVVDGPPGGVGQLARYPAVPVLRDRLHAGAIVVMDDGNRSDENTIARAWERILSASIKRSTKGRGLWILTTGGGSRRG